ncbi:fumarylacetoacetate hydrolase family protein [Rhizobium sp. P32RR-XVIII]|uniref:fumarylacetoacetate hydrolase family protein n=1 Tax=Rhizobium sp. P32RR-XVIII TaxID=2726738 RepID=UPI0014565F86|nr:fumarylacetoacetate hydrolase family protein [Rhizobium sp. P32RR-XVIII]NLS08066.1 fumarylacetoacetate hydrolase family protein [Rhizobium sp. P32RR-XVIII]
MKFVRFGQAGQEKPGIIDNDGKVRDLSSIVQDITGAVLAGSLQQALKGVELASLPLVADGVRLGPCVAEVGNFIAVGLNYADHATETDATIPREPILFNKARSCIVGPYDDVVLPPDSVKSDWEVEIAFVISKKASYLTEAEALDYVGGYFICNDVSEREYQLEREGQWVKGKCCPTFGPIGPWLVTPDEVGDPQKLSLWLEVNGERLQNSSTSNMIFSIRTLVSYISQYMILEPGDIVTTGTPPGVGLGMKPTRFLKRGDTMRLGVEKLGVQEQKVV